MLAAGVSPASLFSSLHPAVGSSPFNNRHAKTPGENSPQGVRRVSRRSRRLSQSEPLATPIGHGLTGRRGGAKEGIQLSCPLRLSSGTSNTATTVICSVTAMLLSRRGYRQPNVVEQPAALKDILNTFSEVFSFFLLETPWIQSLFHNILMNSIWIRDSTEHSSLINSNKTIIWQPRRQLDIRGRWQKKRDRENYEREKTSGEIRMTFSEREKTLVTEERLFVKETFWWKREDFWWDRKEFYWERKIFCDRDFWWKRKGFWWQTFDEREKTFSERDFKWNIEDFLVRDFCWQRKDSSWKREDFWWKSKN